MSYVYTVLLLSLVTTTLISTAIQNDEEIEETEKNNGDLKKDILNEIDKQIEDDIFEDFMENDQQSTDAQFLQELIGNIYSIESRDYHYYHRFGSNDGLLQLYPNGVEKFKVVKALNGRLDSVSFQSAKESDKYLCFQSFYLRLLPVQVNSLQFKNDSSFIIRNNKYFTGYFALESSSYPGYFFQAYSYSTPTFVKQVSNNVEHYRSFRFVQLGDTHIGKCYSFQSRSLPNYYIGVGHDDLATVRLNGDGLQSDHRIHADGFCIVKALNGHSDAVSLQSVNDSSQYLRLQGNILKLHSFDIFSSSYRVDASFILRENYYYPGYIAFEFVPAYRYYLTLHQAETIRLLQEQPLVESYRKDASFKMLPMENSRIGKQYSIQPNNLPKYRVGHLNHDSAAIVFKSLEEFRVVKALNGKRAFVSLQSADDKEKYLRTQAFQLKLQPIDFGSEQFWNDASFNLLESYYYPGYVSIESANNPGYFLRHEHFSIKLLKEEPLNEQYRQAASFKLVKSSGNGNRSKFKWILEMQLKKKLRDHFHKI